MGERIPSAACMADPITLPAGAPIYHNGRTYRLMHATQVEPFLTGVLRVSLPANSQQGGAVFEIDFEQDLNHG